MAIVNLGMSPGLAGLGNASMSALPTQLSKISIPTNTGGGLFSKVGNMFGANKLSGAQGMGISMAGSLVNKLGNSLISDGLSTGVGNGIANIGNTIGGIVGNFNPVLGGIISAGTGIIGGVVNRGWGYDVANADAMKSNTSRLGGISVGDDLASMTSATSNLGLQGTGRIRNGWFTNKGDRVASDLMRNQIAAQAGALGKVSNAGLNLDRLTDNTTLATYSALGGYLGGYPGALQLMQHDDNIEAINNRTNAMYGRKINNELHAFGGELGTNGADFTNGLLQVNAGGLHETNPYQGVQMGVDENGTPNLVEQGETVYDDYVFSNRMKVPEVAYKQLGLGGSLKNGITFADASKKIAKESEERPNDPISKAGLEEGLARLAMIQEAERQREQAEEQINEFALGGPKVSATSKAGVLRRMKDNQRDIARLKAEKEASLPTPGVFGGGDFGSGAGGRFDLYPDYSDRTTFNEAFDAAYEDALSQGLRPEDYIFMYGEKPYTAEKTKNPLREVDNRLVGNSNRRSKLKREDNYQHMTMGIPGSGLQFAQGGYMGNIYKGTGNRPNVLDRSSDESLIRRIFGSGNVTDFLEGIGNAVTDPIGYFAGDEMSAVMDRIAEMSEPQLEKFFSTRVGQALAEGIVALDNATKDGNPANNKNLIVQEAAPGNMRKYAKLARPVTRTVARAARKAYTASRQAGRASLKNTAKGATKPNAAGISPKQAVQQGARGSSELPAGWSLNQGPSNVRLIGSARGATPMNAPAGNLNFRVGEGGLPARYEPFRIGRTGVPAVRQGIGVPATNAGPAFNFNFGAPAVVRTNPWAGAYQYTAGQGIGGLPAVISRAAAGTSVGRGMPWWGWAGLAGGTGLALYAASGDDDTVYNDPERKEDSEYFSPEILALMGAGSDAGGEVSPEELSESLNSAYSSLAGAQRMMSGLYPGYGTPGGGGGSGSMGLTGAGGLDGVPFWYQNGNKATAGQDPSVDNYMIERMRPLLNKMTETPSIARDALAGTPDKIAAPKVRQEIPRYGTGALYAPIIANGIMAATDALGLTNKGDYSDADKIEAAADALGYTPSIAPDPIGNYMKYIPMDITYGLNQLAAKSEATDRGIQNTAGTRGAAMAGMLANGYNSQLAQGNMYRQALEYNDALQKQVEDFNRGTDQFNAQMGLEAAVANARYQQVARNARLSGLAQAAALRNATDQRVGASRSANLTNLVDSLYNLGKRNMILNQINSTAAANNGYWMDANGMVHHQDINAAGGFINKKHERRRR